MRRRSAPMMLTVRDGGRGGRSRRRSSGAGRRCRGRGSQSGSSPRPARPRSRPSAPPPLRQAAVGLLPQPVTGRESTKTSSVSEAARARPADGGRPRTARRGPRPTGCERRDGLERRRGQAEDREVEVTRADVVEHPVAAATPQRHLDPGVVGVEFAQQHRHVEGGGGTPSSPPRPCRGRPRARRRPRRRRGRRRRAPGRRARQPRALAGQPDRPRSALEEVDPELLLELADLPAEGRLDDEFLRRRGAEAAGAGDRAEVAQLTELHALI